VVSEKIKREVAVNINLKKHTVLAMLLLAAVSCAAQTGGVDFAITSFDRGGDMGWGNAFTNGVCTVDTVANLTNTWHAWKNSFTTNLHGTTGVSVASIGCFYRAKAWDLSGGRPGFTNLTRVYGVLTTIAGAGGIQNTNQWRPEFEGGPATNALLSNPHISIANQWGEIYIADKDAHAVRKIRLDGTIVTVAGINVPGNGPDGKTSAVQCALNGPNGLWIKTSGIVFILDSLNYKIRRLDTNGTIQTLFSVSTNYPVERGLWVSESETLAYVAAHATLLKWVKGVGVTAFSTGYNSLGNLDMDTKNRLVVTDRYGNTVYRLDASGNRTAIAGNGSTTNNVGGGDGGPALATGLEEVRGIWFLPTGAYFLCTHKGSQVWYVDTEGLIHLFINGYYKENHAGDNTWFYNPAEYRVSKCRAVTVDCEGNVLITENDMGYVRKVRFLPYEP
jgi:hypothetical protein